MDVELERDDGCGKKRSRMTRKRKHVVTETTQLDSLLNT